MKFYMELLNDDYGMLDISTAIFFCKAALEQCAERK